MLILSGIKAILELLKLKDKLKEVIEIAGGITFLVSNDNMKSLYFIQNKDIKRGEKNLILKKSSYFIKKLQPKTRAILSERGKMEPV